MKSTTFPVIKISKKLALLLPLALSMACTSANAQAAFDTSALMTAGDAMASNGATGNFAVRSYKTGEAPASAGLYGNRAFETGRQTGGPMGTLLLNPAGTAGLAPVFGGISGYDPGIFSIGINGNGFGIGISDGPGGIGISGYGNIGGVNVQGGIPLGGDGGFGPPGFGGGPPGFGGGSSGIPGPPGGFQNGFGPSFGAPGGSMGGLPGMPGGGMPGMPGGGGLPGMPTIGLGGNFNIGGTNVNVGMPNIGDPFGF